jgi:hypothetical protein
VKGCFIRAIGAFGALREGLATLLKTVPSDELLAAIRSKRQAESDAPDS